MIASRGKKQAKVVELPPSSDSAEEESDEDGVWVEKKISTIISLAFYLSLLFCFLSLKVKTLMVHLLVQSQRLSHRAQTIKWSTL